MWHKTEVSTLTDWGWTSVQPGETKHLNRCHYITCWMWLWLFRSRWSDKLNKGHFIFIFRLIHKYCIVSASCPDRFGFFEVWTGIFLRTGPRVGRILKRWIAWMVTVLSLSSSDRKLSVNELWPPSGSSHNCSPAHVPSMWHFTAANVWILHC